MIISQVVVMLSALFLAVTCYSVAVFFGKKNKESCREEKVEKFLYRNIGVALASISNAGAMISFYVMIVGNVLMTLGWGSVLFVSTIAGITASLAIFSWRLCAQEGFRCHSERTVIDKIASNGNLRGAIFLTFLMLVYSVATIGSEIEAIGILEKALSADGERSGLVTEAGESAFRVNIFILITCLAYVIRGGYIGVIAVDVVQILLLVVLYVFAMVHISKFDLMGVFHRNFLISSETIIASISTAVLIFGWTLGSCCLWIRTVGLSEFNQEQADNKISIDERVENNRRRIRKVVFFTWLVAVITTAIPSFLGLILRDGLHKFYPECVQSDVQRKSLVEIPALAELNSKAVPLIAKNSACALVPPSAINIPRYTNFTNYPFNALTAIVAYELDQVVDVGALVSTLLILALITAALLSSALTTVSALTILAGQLLQGIGRKIRRGVFQNPWRVMAGFGVCTLFVTISPFYSTKFYLSVGVFAWSSMLFLGFSSMLSTFYGVGNVKLKRCIDWQMWAYFLWFSLIVVPHFAVISLGHESGILLSDKIAQRSAMPILAFVISSVAISCCLGYSMLVEKGRHRP